jgi:hypothetical protein
VGSWPELERISAPANSNRGRKIIRRFRRILIYVCVLAALAALGAIGSLMAPEAATAQDSKTVAVTPLPLPVRPPRQSN